MRIIYFITALLLAGCVNVNLKSKLPEQSYYSLDNIMLDSNAMEKCTSITPMALNVNVLSPYDGKDILLYNSDSSITIMQSYKWIDLPKNMIRNVINKIAISKCVKIEQNLSLIQKIKTLKITILDMYVKNKERGSSAYVSLSYSLGEKDKILSVEKSDENPAKALQDSVIEALYGVFNEI